MQADDFYNDEDAYQQRVLRELEPSANPTGGIAGPTDFPSPQTGANPTGVFKGAANPGYDLEAFRKSWMGSGDVNNAQGWLDQNRSITNGVTLKGEKAYDPSGRFIADLVGNYSGGDPSQRSRIFLDGIGSNGLPRTATGSGGAKATAVAKTAAMGGGTAPATAPAANPFHGQIRQLLMDRMGQMSKDPSLDDPTLAAQNQSYGRARDRGAAETRAAMAERAAQQGQIMGGQSSGSFDTELRSITEGAGEDKAAYGAQLLGNEVQQRRAEMQQLLNMALQSGDAESARELSMALSKMDLEYRRQALAQQGSQFNADLGYRNRALDQSGSQFNANLGQQRYMYDDTTGFNTWRANEDDDYRNSVLAAWGK